MLQMQQDTGTECNLPPDISGWLIIGTPKSRMECDYDDYILDDDLPMVPVSAIEYWPGSDYDDDSDEEYEFDKNGRRCWRKKKTWKGDDRSKSIHWSKLFPNFDHGQLDKRQEQVMAEKHLTRNGASLTPEHTVQNARHVFREIFDRKPGYYRRCEYVRNVADCDYYCKLLLDSPVLPGVVGVDVEMENDRVPFRYWNSKWRTIRAHSRLAKGAFARLFQVANCHGLVVVFDLYALAEPHCWSGGVECEAKAGIDWSAPTVTLPTSTLPDSLVRFILDPNIVRFGWALHCDWSSLYNSFGLVVPQLSYFDAQAPWRYELSCKLYRKGNGLADAASGLFGLSLDKSLRGYGHFWHGRPPHGKIPSRLIQYAAKDAQTSLDVALYILVRTNWLADWANVWPSANVKSEPMPGTRERVCFLFNRFGERVSRNAGQIELTLEPAAGVSTDEVEASSQDGQGEISCVTVRSLQTKEDESILADTVDDTVERDWNESEDGEVCCKRLVYHCSNGNEADVKIEEIVANIQSSYADEIKDEKGCVEEMDSGISEEVSLIQEELTFENMQIVSSGQKRIIVKVENTPDNKRDSDNPCSAQGHSRRFPAVHYDDHIWSQLPASAREYIIKSKFESLKIFEQMLNSRGAGSEWSWCPGYLLMRGVKHHVLKRIILGEKSDYNGLRQSKKQALILYRKARQLCDYNLEWAWQKVLSKRANGKKCGQNVQPLKACKKFQRTNLNKMMNTTFPAPTTSTTFRERGGLKSRAKTKCFTAPLTTIRNVAFSSVR